MKIICATINSKYIHSSLSPWCLKAGVESFCTQKHSVEVFEHTINGNVNDFAKSVCENNPDIIAFSCYIWNINFIIELCSVIEAQSPAIIVLGGPESSNRRIELLEKYSFIDYIISGEGEWTFSDFINKLCDKKPLTECEGLTFRNNDRIISNPCKIHDETPPSPYSDEYFSKLNDRITYIESSRGCPFRCSYCLSGTLSKMRCFDLKQIFDDIIRLSSSGTKTVKFIDRTFNADSRHCNEILKFILKEYGKSIPENVCFHFEISADILTDETISLFNMMPQGLCQLEIGIQSYNTKTLTAINRHCNLNKLDFNIKRLLKSENIHIHTDLIAGLPFEDFSSFRDSFNRAFSLNSHMLQLGILKLLHGADINNVVSDYKYCFNTSPPYEIQNNLWLSSDELDIIKSCESAIDKLYNSGRFNITISYLLNETSFSPFDLFCSFGKAIDLNKISLSDLSVSIYFHFKNFCDENILRESILCDLASIDANIHIPHELINYSKKYKPLKKLYTEKFQCNVKIVECTSQNKVYVVKSVSNKDLFGRRNGNYYPI